MDSTTHAVRDMYEAYPYPSGSPEVRLGFDARYILSLVDRARPAPGPIQVLDAGCGRALGLIGAAQLQPDVAFHGADMNRRALVEARAEASARGLTNVAFSEVDLTDLTALPIPDDGYDVIHSSGVIHHMVDPAAALTGLRQILAPHGVVVLMVYGRAGRAGYARVTRAIDALIDRSAPIPERLAVGRELALALRDDTPWREAAACDDVEFVDRYLHVQETSYDVSGLLGLVERAGLRPLAWCDDAAWSLDVLPESIAARVRQLPRRVQWTVIEQITQPNRFEIYLTHADVASRRALTGAAAADEWFAMNPEVTFEVGTRALFGQVRTESLRFSVSGGEPVPIPAGPVAAACLLLRDQVVPFTGADFVAGMSESGFTGGAAGQALGQLLRMGAIYRPHAVDCVPVQTH